MVEIFESIYMAVLGAGDWLVAWVSQLFAENKEALSGILGSIFIMLILFAFLSEI